MSILAALTRAYERLPDAAPYGYSSEKIGFCIVLNPDGTVTEVADLRDTDKKCSPRLMLVPQGKKFGLRQDVHQIRCCWVPPACLPA